VVVVSLRESPPVRPAGGHFGIRQLRCAKLPDPPSEHLLAQMKVTKAKGLNTDLTGSPGYNPRTRTVHLMRSLAADALLPRNMSLRAERIFFVGRCHGSEPNRISPFALATFIWGRK